MLTVPDWIGKSVTELFDSSQEIRLDKVYHTVVCVCVCGGSEEENERRAVYPTCTCTSSIRGAEALPIVLEALNLVLEPMSTVHVMYLHTLLPNYLSLIVKSSTHNINPSTHAW